MKSIDLQSLAAAATAIGVFFATAQLWMQRGQARTSFEDALSKEYREVAQSLPIAALLGEELSDAGQKDALDEFYRYIDLTNEQIFLRVNGRVSRAAWRNWADGIHANLSRPAFKAAWAEIKTRAPGSFGELRRLEYEAFRIDPRWWRWRPR